MIKFDPKGNYLMEFCFINIFLFENTVILYSNASIFEKIQFYFVKRKVKLLVTKTAKLIMSGSISNVDQILKKLLTRNANIWDSLLLIVIVKETIRPLSVKRQLQFEQLVRFVVLEYVTEVKELGNYMDNELQIKYNLLKAKVEWDLSMTLLKVT